MNLNKQQQQQWQIITSVFAAVSTMAPDEQTLLTLMKPHVDGFEASLAGKAKVKIRFAPAPSIAWIDCSRDGLKVSKDANGITMRARIEGIGIVTIVSYKESYAHSNLAIADSLEALAAGLRKIPTDMKDLTESGDLSNLIGIQISAEDDDEELDGEAKPLIPAAIIDTPTPVVAAAAPAPVAEDPEEKNLVELFAPAGSVGEPDEPVEV
ncbi:hypothetical protein [Pseudomonas sp. PLMAX]|uniref:hypothetical protein n=1 Tax=Pseudomonas sp. PLMAX TaxID=2201998 RepID=UPI0038BA76B7